MASTNKTQHYDLSQFLATDKPSWTGDINADMLKIDTAIFNAQTTGTGAASDAAGALTAAQNAQTAAEAAQTAATSAQEAASAAQTAATTANGTATEAKTAATSAQETAVSAASAASSAQTTANAAAAAAGDAQNTANQAKSGADSANQQISMLGGIEAITVTKIQILGNSMLKLYYNSYLNLWSISAALTPTSDWLPSDITQIGTFTPPSKMIVNTPVTLSVPCYVKMADNSRNTFTALFTINKLSSTSGVLNMVMEQPTVPSGTPTSVDYCRVAGMFNMRD